MEYSKMDPDDVRKSKSGIIINDGSLAAGLLVKHKHLLVGPQYWHKIIVNNCENLQRDVILKAILDAAYPHDLIPVNYKSNSYGTYFLARNCKAGIEKLCQQNLIVQNPQNRNLPFKLTIVLGYSNTNELKINVQDNVAEVLSKRYNPSLKMLNLDAFYKDPDLDEFCILSQPKLLYFVLHLSRNFDIQQLKLSNNEISILSPAESLWGVKHLSSLDLRNNYIKSMKELTILSTLPIHELWLDGNPLCDDYDEYTYVQAVKEVCPQIEKLDGLLLRQGAFPAFRRNYLCNPEGQELLDQFLEHYFTSFDSDNRNILASLYRNDASFSLTCSYIIGQSTSPSANLMQYKNYARNLRTLSDLAKSEENLIRGRTNIIKTLSSLPLTEHDPYTFTVDLVFYSDKLAVVVVTGVFRERKRLLPERILGFTRTFVLVSVGSNEYNIINEQLHLSNATTAQHSRAFKLVKIPKAKISSLPKAVSEKEKDELVETVKVITTMNAEWSKKCLEECSYDLKRALILFVDLYKLDNIPEEAFKR